MAAGPSSELSITRKPASGAGLVLGIVVTFLF
jgi:hypothetical protein